MPALTQGQIWLFYEILPARTRSTQKLPLKIMLFHIMDVIFFTCSGWYFQLLLCICSTKCCQLKLTDCVFKTWMQTPTCFSLKYDYLQKGNPMQLKDTVLKARIAISPLLHILKIKQKDDNTFRYTLYLGNTFNNDLATYRFWNNTKLTKSGGNRQVLLLICI